MHNEHPKKRQTKKVNNQFRPLETNVWRRKGRLAQTKKRMLANMWVPSNGFSIRLTRSFPGGMPDTTLGSKIADPTKHGPS